MPKLLKNLYNDPLEKARDGLLQRDEKAFLRTDNQLKR
jgi:hypothetical protein